jgi:hypothetical protein
VLQRIKHMRVQVTPHGIEHGVKFYQVIIFVLRNPDQLTTPPNADALLNSTDGRSRSKLLPKYEIAIVLRKFWPMLPQERAWIAWNESRTV